MCINHTKGLKLNWTSERESFPYFQGFVKEFVKEMMEIYNSNCKIKARLKTRKLRKKSSHFNSSAFLKAVKKKVAQCLRICNNFSKRL